MSPILTNRQAEELHKSIIAYLTANNLLDTANTLRAELNLNEDAFDPATAKKYETLLEKKWTSVVRLQKKIMDLESRMSAMQAELDNATPTSLSKRNKDPASWIPTAPARHALESHRDTINSVAFHPIFSSVASASDDCTIKIWDWELGELERTIKGHTRAVVDVDFGGPRGGILLASCSSDLSIKLWDPSNEYKNIRTLVGHDHSVSAVRFIPLGASGAPSSGNLLASASRDKSLKIWDANTGYCLRTLQGHTAWVRDVFPSPDGRFLLSTGDDSTARLWDISVSNPETKIWDARGTCLLTLAGHDNWIRALAFHPGGKYLFSVSDDRTLRCWDLSQEGKCIKVMRDAHERFITCLRWAPSIFKDAPAGNGASDGRNGDNKKADSPEVQIRCVIATGGVDMKLRIFAN
ncbi:WD40/YVTN repeat-like-containing domain [Trichophyton rubrum]|nr:WD40/YVTN repeat-like-containing domain [Trichophyton rubrum]